MRKTILINGALNAKIVGQKRPHHREAGRHSTPEDRQDPHRRGGQRGAWRKSLPTKAVSLFWPCTRPRTFDEAVAKADPPGADGGYGHTSSLYVDAVSERAKIDRFARGNEDLPHSGQHPPPLRAVSATCTTSSWPPS